MAAAARACSWRCRAAVMVGQGVGEVGPVLPQVAPARRCRRCRRSAGTPAGRRAGSGVVEDSTMAHSPIAPLFWYADRASRPRSCSRTPIRLSTALRSRVARCSASTEASSSVWAASSAALACSSWSRASFSAVCATTRSALALARSLEAATSAAASWASSSACCCCLAASFSAALARASASLAWSGLRAALGLGQVVPAAVLLVAAADGLGLPVGVGSDADAGRPEPSSAAHRRGDDRGRRRGTPHRHRSHRASPPLV